MSINRGNRARPGARGTGGRNSGGGGRGVYRGEAARLKGEDELVKQKAAQEARKNQTHMPFRFRVAVGETTEFVILDDEPDFHRFEHNMQDGKSGLWNIFTGCTKEWDNCPACDALGRDSYYALYLSVIDFTPFTTSDNKTHDFSRKLLVVKPAQQKKFYRAFAKAQAEGRTLRGAVFSTTRDGEKDASIGNDIEFVEFMEEDDLQTYTRSWKDRENKKHTENCWEVYDYDELFPEPDSEELRAIVGGEPPAGSRRHEERELGGRTSRAAAPSTRRGRSAPAEDGDDGDDGDGDGDDGDGGGYEAPARNERMGSRRAAAPARTSRESSPPPRGSRGRSAPAEDGDDGDGPPFEPSNRRAGSAPAPSRAPGTGRRTQRR